MTESRSPITHVLKTWPFPFGEIWCGDKTFEVRKTDDRDFRLGDTLRLLEYMPTVGIFTDRWIVAEVTFMAHAGQWGLPRNLCVMALGGEIRKGEG